MNFFEQQDRARRKTGTLVLLFAVAVAGIVVALYIASRLLLRYSSTGSTGPHLYPWWDAGAFAFIAACAVLLIGGASWIKTRTLRRGGAVVAEMLGGRPVPSDTNDPAERRLRNVVEEMAIASGIPVPKVYVLDGEEGINAFAAGFTQNDAAIAVTRGCLRTLDRDELQGVIAHEFSHVLNGDMGLNIRLIGILFGILVIGIIGGTLLRVGGSSRRGSRKGTPVIALAGLLLMLIGYIGIFVGRMIQSAVSRQREYLADSSAVQFTRHPAGIAGALKKIGGYARGSTFETPKAEQASHLFFASGIGGLFAGLFATHPPLVERIRRIEPGFSGRFPAVLPEEFPGEGASGRKGEGPPRGPDETGLFSLGAAGIVGRVGRVTENPAIAGGILRMIPSRARGAVTTPSGAAALLAAMLLDEDEETRGGQIETLRKIGGPAAPGETLEIFESVRGIDERARLPLADLAAPALRDLGLEKRRLFLACLDALIHADRKVTLFEFTLRWVVDHRLRRSDQPPARIRFTSTGPLLGDAAEILGDLAREGASGDAAAARSAFACGSARLTRGGKVALPFDPEGTTSFSRLDRALRRMARAAHPVKERLVDACAHVVLADRKVTAGEAELLRLVTIALDCPMPPFPALIESAVPCQGSSQSGAD